MAADESYILGLPSRLSKFTALTTLRISECSGTVITKMPSWEKLTSLTTLKLPTVLFPADVFTELLDHLRALRCLSVSMSVLLLRLAHSDEPAIEYYDDHTFPTELRYLSFHQFTVRGFAPSKHLAASKQEEAYVADAITEDTVQHLSDILQASTRQLEVLKFKLDPGAYTLMNVGYAFVSPNSVCFISARAAHPRVCSDGCCTQLTHSAV